MSVNMKRVYSTNVAWEYENDYSSGAAQETIYMPAKIGMVTMTLSFTSGSGKIQTTTNKKDTVDAGTATWVDWPYGAVSTTKQKWMYPCTAIRVVRSTGTCHISIRAQ